MIVATFTFICDKCGRIAVEAQKAEAYSDPVIAPPEEWDYLQDGKTFACPPCRKEESHDNAENPRRHR